MTKKLRVAKHPKDGECHVMRCKAVPCMEVAGGAIICEKHYAVWHEENVPAPQVPSIIGEPEVLPAPGAEYKGPGPRGFEKVFPFPETKAEPETALVPVKPDNLAEQVLDLKDILTMTQELAIADQDDLDFAKDCLVDIKAQFKDLETRRKEATGPMNAALKAVNSWFKPAKDTAQAVEKILKGKILQAAQAFAAKERALEEAARAAQAEGDMEAVRETLMKAAEAPADTSGVSFRDRWVFEIADAEKLPAEFWCPDLEAIAAVVKAKKGDTNIPGVVVKNDPIVATLGRRG